MRKTTSSQDDHTSPWPLFETVIPAKDLQGTVCQVSSGCVPITNTILLMPSSTWISQYRGRQIGMNIPARMKSETWQCGCLSSLRPLSHELQFENPALYEQFRSYRAAHPRPRPQLTPPRRPFGARKKYVP